MLLEILADSNEFPFTTAVSDTTAPTIDSGVPVKCQRNIYFCTVEGNIQ